ncbi:hypothetical protein HK097_000152, partial [Rhizophlyctis rosea]
MTSRKERQSQFEALFAGPTTAAAFEQFRQLCFQGIPDSPKGLRPKCWKVLLGYLPWAERERWDKIQNEQRNLYYTFVKEFVKDLSQEELESARKGKVEDHPLNDSKDSKWQSYFEELAILEQIDKDVRRTLPDIAFFQLPIKTSIPTPLHPLHNEFLRNDGVKPFSPIQSRRALFKRLDHLDDFGSRKRSPQHSPTAKTAEADPSNESADSENKPQQLKEGEVEDLHWEAVERILFIFAKLNPGIGYVQGMNEILAPLYYVIANDTEEEARAHAEADAFYAFSAFMGEFRDHFIRSLDNVQPGTPVRTPSSMSFDEKAKSPLPSRKNSIAEKAMEQAGGNGVGSSMARLMKRLRRRDLELWKDMQSKSIHAAFFSFRWLTVLLTQEFPLPDLIRIWDSLIADIAVDIEERGRSPTASVPELDVEREGQFDFLIDFCCAMLICVRDELLAGSFADNVKLLQNYPSEDVDAILQRVYSFREAPLSPSRSEADEWQHIDSTPVPLPIGPSGEILYESILYPDRFKDKNRNAPMWSNLLQPNDRSIKMDIQRGLSNAAVVGSNLLAGLGRDVKRAASAVAVTNPAVAVTPNVALGADPGARLPPPPSSSAKPPLAPTTTTTARAPTQPTSITAVGDTLKEGFTGFVNRVRSTASVQQLELPPPPSEMPDEG